MFSAAVSYGPICQDRRKYFTGKVIAARPHLGYRQLCCMAEAGLIEAVWTTNFDGLVARAAADFSIAPVEVGVDCQIRLPRSLHGGELLCVSLHGDYRYDHLKNTKDKLRQQETALCAALIDRVSSRPLVVCGYSGRDESIMAALNEAYSRRGEGSLFWCGREGDEIPEAVQSLLETARASGRVAHLVGIQGFDDLLVRLALHCLSGSAIERARKLIQKARPQQSDSRAEFALPDLPVRTVLRSNAHEVECPAEVLEFKVRELPAKGAWDWVESMTVNHAVVAVPHKGKVVALGTLQAVKGCFGEHITGKIGRTPIGEKDLRYEDGDIVSLLRQGLMRAIASARGLHIGGRAVLWDKENPDLKHVHEAPYLIHRAVLLFLRPISGRMYVILKPSAKVRTEAGEEAPEEMEEALKRELFGWQHNAKFHYALEGWRTRLFAGEKEERVCFEFPPNSGSTFVFSVSPAPIFAGVRAKGGTTKLPGQRFIKHEGFRLPEPQLVFTAAHGHSFAKDSHPIRGIVNNRPDDFALTTRGLATSVRLGIVCSQGESKALAQFLSQAHSKHIPGNTERDYLLDYPGFQGAFRVPLEVPEPGSDGWATYPDPPGVLGSMSAGVEMARAITRSIESLRAGYAPSVVLVFTPARLDPCRRIDAEDERFDLHDFVKAYCVARSVATQFLKEEKLSEKQSCRLWWWLSLA